LYYQTSPLKIRIPNEEPKEKNSAKQTVSLQRLAEAKERLEIAIEGLDHDDMCTEHVVGEWTVKDILGHIVSWNQEFRANIEAIRNGKHPGDDHRISEEDDFSRSNQAWYAEKRDWSLDRILIEAENDYTAAVDIIMKLTPKELRLRGVTPWKDAAFSRPRELTKLDTD
jgi:hypothetical protein